MKDQNVINGLKGLVIDGVHAAQSGHPGGPLSSMDLAYILFTEFLSFNPDDSNWLARDRFILSAGHESMLLYALLYANGWLKRDDLMRFRQLHSKTPGHPENTLTPGVECTTGPLGQGAAMSVGFAIAATHLKGTFGPQLFNHRVWSLLGDGCIQEDITYGSASYAGHLGLGQLNWIYDENNAQISGKVDRAFSDRVEDVYAGMGWHVQRIDGHNHQAIRQAYQKAFDCLDKPSLIIAQTVMAKGSANMEGNYKTHGAPFTSDERMATKKALGLPVDQDFYWSEDLSQHYCRNFSQKSQKAQIWEQALRQNLTNPSFHKLWEDYFGQLDPGSLPDIDWGGKAIATRSAFGKIIHAWCPKITNLVGGSADLEPSNMTQDFAKEVRDFSKNDPKGRNFAYGVREFPMSAISNGLSLHGGFKVFDATFLAFSDYSRPAIRLGAIQEAPVVHELTHDSFYLGEDGPTHQPIEQIMSLRLIPNLLVIRPADAIETEVLLKAALWEKRPSCLCLSRQNLPIVTDLKHADAIKKGAWYVRKDQSADAILYASGSEVSLALELAEHMEKQKLRSVHSVAVVSTPCWELFFDQSPDYQKTIFGNPKALKVSIEAGSTLGWQTFVGATGLSIGIDTFGASGPAHDLAREFGFTVDSIINRILEHSF